ncbi:hypothetical protein ACQP3L_37065, partial [Escherichia coli]
TEIENNPRIHVTPEKTPEIQHNLKPKEESWWDCHPRSPTENNFPELETRLQIPKACVLQYLIMEFPAQSPRKGPLVLWGLRADP